LAPIHVKIVNLLISVHKIVFVVGLFFFLFFFVFVIIGRMNTTRDPARAITPPSFEGIERRIA
jgi:hypothetical protein